MRVLSWVIAYFDARSPVPAAETPTAPTPAGVGAVVRRVDYWPNLYVLSMTTSPKAGTTTAISARYLVATQLGVMSL
jgi:hypothetical protein